MLDPSLPMLMLDDRFFPGVLRGTTTATIRIGERAHLAEGNRVLMTSTRGGFLPILVEITGLRTMPYEDLATWDIHGTGYVSFDEAKASLVHFYPSIAWSTPITIIEFEKL